MAKSNHCSTAKSQIRVRKIKQDYINDILQIVENNCIKLTVKQLKTLSARHALS